MLRGFRDSERQPPERREDIQVPCNRNQRRVEWRRGRIDCQDKAGMSFEQKAVHPS